MSEPKITYEILIKGDARAVSINEKQYIEAHICLAKSTGYVDIIKYDATPDRKTERTSTATIPWSEIKQLRKLEFSDLVI